MPQLELVSALGAGYENLAVDHARSRGIVLVNGAGTNDHCVADHAFALAARGRARRAATRSGHARRRLARHACRCTRTSRASASASSGSAISARRSRGAARASRWRSAITTVSRVKARRIGTSTAWKALARWSDFLIVATPGGAGTRHLIGAAVLDALGPHGFVVNVSRGSVLDTAALAQALTARHDCRRRARRLRGRAASARGLAGAAQRGVDAACGRPLAGSDHGLGRQLSEQRQAAFCGRAGVDADLTSQSAIRGYFSSLPPGRLPMYSYSSVLSREMRSSTDAAMIRVGDTPDLQQRRAHLDAELRAFQFARETRRSRVHRSRPR